MAVKTKRRQIKPLRLEDFKYLVSDALPQLVLGIEIDRRSFDEDNPGRDYQFKGGRTWLKLAHQAGGHACHQHYMVATLLTPKTPQVGVGMALLAKKWLGTDTGCLGVSLDEVLRYRADLKRMLSADCNATYRSFEEAWYGIDLEFLPELAADTLPKDLDELVEWESGFQRSIGAINRWRLVVVGPNGD